MEAALTGDIERLITSAPLTAKIVPDTFSRADLRYPRESYDFFSKKYVFPAKLIPRFGKVGRVLEVRIPTQRSGL